MHVLAYIYYAQVQGRRKAGSARSPEPGPAFLEAPRSTKIIQLKNTYFD